MLSMASRAGDASGDSEVVTVNPEYVGPECFWPQQPNALRRAPSGSPLCPPTPVLGTYEHPS